jgi:hypothetical protein
VNSSNWIGLLGIGLCVLAAAIILAVAAGVYLAHQWVARQESQRLNKARILRAQFLSQLQFIEAHLTPRAHPLNDFGHELYEPLQALWMQADLLRPEEMEAVHRTCRLLLMLRKNPTLNKKDVNMATVAIHQTIRIFEKQTSQSLNPS